MPPEKSQFCVSFTTSRVAYHACREEETRLDIVERNITRYLPDSVSDSKNRVNLVQLIAMKVQLFPHSGHIGIIKVCSIQIVQKIHKTAGDITLAQFYI